MRCELSQHSRRGQGLQHAALDRRSGSRGDRGDESICEGLGENSARVSSPAKNVGKVHPYRFYADQHFIFINARLGDGVF